MVASIQVERLAAPDAASGEYLGDVHSSRPHLLARVRVGTTSVRRNRSHGAAPEATTAALVPDLSVAAPRVRLGDLLVHSGIVSRDALERVSQHANGTGSARSSIERGMIAEDDVTRALSEQLHVPVVDLRDASSGDAPRPRWWIRPTRTATTCSRCSSPTARSPSRSSTRSTSRSWRSCVRCP